jgi:hypothetical protein
MGPKALSVILVCSAATFAAEPSWELAPPDAKVLSGIDVRSLRNSPVGEAITAQMRAQMQTQTPTPIALFHLPGAELLDDVDAVFIFSNGDVVPAPASAAAKAAAPKAASATRGNAPVEALASTVKKTTPSFLMAITGTFPDEHLRPLLKGPHPSYRGINVYRGQGPEPIAVAILDEHTVLVGDEKSIYRAVDRKTTGTIAQGPLFDRAKALAAENDAWVVARDNSGNLQKTAGPFALFAAEMEGIDLGVALRDGFNMNISLATKTEAGAQMFSQLILTQMQSAVHSKMQAEKAGEFWKKVKVSAEGKRMQVQVALTKEDVQENIRLMQEQRAGRAEAAFATRKRVEPSPTTAPLSSNPASPASLGASTVPAAAAQPAASAALAQAPTPSVSVQPQAPPKPRVAKIYGLEEGVREVRLDPEN